MEIIVVDYGHYPAFWLVHLAEMGDSRFKVARVSTKLPAKAGLPLVKLSDLQFWRESGGTAYSATIKTGDILYKSVLLAAIITFRK